ncbi:hypothetical protein POJ06DRAFT_271419 [Lipomyces tetrasporus]|uniref:RRM domain-containing protein n=1 Tax=Lipomyces tetrasporus TaxID=54092 RepID=A0AAD7QL97_9ASCO|nr:uncharacterized protein POJ06DRAFT_271419 [Lipomyces tetrasporus]KAJ8097050.1 hypothetical protein POJ06DRAFT_271419 [Lipomyces tetrasporus]
MPKRVSVEKLTRNVNEGHMRDIFSTYGTITNLLIPMNQKLRTNRGVCYISYETEDEADNAIAHMNDGYIDGAQVIVKHAMPPPSQRRGFGGPPRGGFRAARNGGGRWGARDSYVPPGSSSRRRSRSPPSYRDRERYDSGRNGSRYRSPSNERRRSRY